MYPKTKGKYIFFKQWAGNLYNFQNQKLVTDYIII